MKIIACALWLAACGPGQAQTYSYSTFDPPGSTSTVVNGMNNAGQIVGSYRDAAGTYGFLRSADGATYTTIVVPGSEAGTTTTDAINNLGQIVGNYIDASSGFFRSYIRSADGGTFTAFDIPNFGPGGGPKGINDNGAITGSGGAARASAPPRLRPRRRRHFHYHQHVRRRHPARGHRQQRRNRRVLYSRRLRRIGPWFSAQPRRCVHHLRSARHRQRRAALLHQQPRAGSGIRGEL